jgi:hypothetical protein
MTVPDKKRKKEKFDIVDIEAKYREDFVFLVAATCELSILSERNRANIEDIYHDSPK